MRNSRITAVLVVPLVIGDEATTAAAATTTALVEAGLKSLSLSDYELLLRVLRRKL